MTTRTGDPTRIDEGILAELRARLIDLPLDVALPRRPGTRPGGSTGHVPVLVPAGIVRALADRSAPGIPAAAALAAGFLAVLHHYSRQPSFLVGMEQRRPDGSPDVSAVAAKVTPGLPMDTLARSVGAELAAALRRPRIPVPVLAALLGRPAEADRALFKVRLRIAGDEPAQQGERPKGENGGSPDAPAELFLALRTGPDGAAAGRLEFDAGIYEPAMIDRLTRHYLRLLGEWARQPGMTATGSPPATVGDADARPYQAAVREDPWATVLPLHQMVEQHARERGQLAAFTGGDRVLTFSELNRTANQLARRLKAAGVSRGDIVAMCLERDDSWLRTLLAAGKLGAVVCPLDPRVPVTRLREEIAAVAPRVLLHPASPAPAVTGPVLLPADDAALVGYDDSDLGISVSAEEFAYVFHTSGTSGRPKSILGQHRAATHAGASFAGLMGTSAGSRVAWLTPAGFGVTLAVASQGLSAAATLVSAPAGVTASPATLQEWLIAERVDGCFLGTQVGDALHQLPWPAEVPLRVTLLGGEKLHRWGPVGLPYESVVGYGCHEAMFVASGLRLGLPHVSSRTASAQDRESPPPIGWPHPGVRLRILSEDLDPLPPGVLGEIWFDGPERALGYFGDPARTAESFRPDPFGPPGARLYRSGDLGRFRVDGQLEHHGRSDDMVKVRGCRVELGEVEGVLAAHPLLAAAVVVAAADPAGHTQLVACVIPAGDVTPAQLRAHLASRLPDYMIPAAFVTMPEFPRSANGKVDRLALPPADWLSRRPRSPHRPPTSGLEATITALWSQVLDIPDLGADESFLDLGGTSLHAGRLLTRLREVTGLEVSQQEVFLFPAPSGLARLLQERVPATPLPRDAAPRPVPRRRAG